MATPERLSIWDRLFNRYRKEIHDRGTENRITYLYDPLTGQTAKGSERSYTANWIEYKIIDRVTGSETIKRERI